MMNQPKYTFLLPAFKAKYLTEMLDSIKKQTYTYFKVLISDDCSPEPLYEVCKSYLNDSRFSYRRNAKNMGSKSLVSHWNLLVNMCDTEFLIMASDDDVYDENFLKEIDRLTIKYSEVDFFRARIKRIDEKGDCIQKDVLLDEYENQLEYMYNMFSCPNQIHCMQNNVFRTDALKKRGGCVEFPLAWFSDDATAIVMAYNGVVNTSNYFFYFRSSDSQISSSSRISCTTAYEKSKAGIIFLNWVLETVKVDKFVNKWEQNMRIYFWHFVSTYVFRIIEVNFNYLPLKKFKEIIQELKRLNIVVGKYQTYCLYKKWFVKNKLRKQNV